MKISLKAKLLLYALATGFSFAFIAGSGIGWTISVLIQVVVFLLLIQKREEVTNKKALFLFLPIIILSFKFALRANSMFDFANVVLSILLFSAMILMLKDKLFVKKTHFNFMRNTLHACVKPFTFIDVPFKFMADEGKNNKKTKIIQKVILGVLVSLPVLFVILVLLSLSDFVFEKIVDDFLKAINLENLSSLFIDTIFFVVYAIYSFGLVYVLFEDRFSYWLNQRRINRVNTNYNYANNPYINTAGNQVNGAGGGQFSPEQNMDAPHLQGSDNANLNSVQNANPAENLAQQQDVQKSCNINMPSAHSESEQHAATGSGAASEENSPQLAQLPTDASCAHTDPAQLQANGESAATQAPPAPTAWANQQPQPQYMQTGYNQFNPQFAQPKQPEDLIIFTILHSTILIVYTIFCAVQFKYLFVNTQTDLLQFFIDEGLTYSQYARRGFNELLILSFINIGLILFTMHCAKVRIYEKKVAASGFLKVMMLYMCAVTFVLLASSFYRMTLYSGAYGFTILRVLVMIFLAFEALGLVATFIYIIRPTFNIVAVYTCICIAFYLCINIINLDRIIARNNIDLYLDGTMEELDIYYLHSLSADAAPEMLRLKESTDNEFLQEQVDAYFENIIYMNEFYDEFKDYNVSVNSAIEQYNSTLVQG